MHSRSRPAMVKLHPLCERLLPWINERILRPIVNGKQRLYIPLRRLLGLKSELYRSLLCEVSSSPAAM